MQASILQYCEDVQKNSRDTSPDTIELGINTNYSAYFATIYVWLSVIFSWKFY